MDFSTSKGNYNDDLTLFRTQSRLEAKRDELSERLKNSLGEERKGLQETLNRIQTTLEYGRSGEVIRVYNEVKDL